MNIVSQTSREIYLEYRNHYSSLINTYCQVKRNNPFADYPLLMLTIKRVGVCMEFWWAIALIMEKREEI